MVFKNNWPLYILCTENTFVAIELFNAVNVIMAWVCILRELMQSFHNASHWRSPLRWCSWDNRVNETLPLAAFSLCASHCRHSTKFPASPVLLLIFASHICSAPTKQFQNHSESVLVAASYTPFKAKVSSVTQWYYFLPPKAIYQESYISFLYPSWQPTFNSLLSLA